MLRRLFVFTLVTALLVAAAVWLADRPGEVMVRWLGWRLDTSVPVLIVALLVVGILVQVVLRLGQSMITAPGRLLSARRARRLRDGYRALSDGLAAVAAGDKRSARRLAKRADALLSDHALTGVLTARAAELSGNAVEAEQHFQAMLGRAETTALGLKGLLGQAVQRGDHAAALEYARRAWSSSVPGEGLAATLFDLQARAGQWGEAEMTLAEAKKRGAMTADELRRRQALVFNERAGLAEAAGDAAEGAGLAMKAHAADPTLVAAACRAAKLLHRMGKDSKAAAIIETTWRMTAHPALVTAWHDLAPAETALMRVKRLERLVRAEPDAPAGHMALAEAALDAQLWGTARAHLEAAVTLASPAGAANAVVYRLLARLERQEKGDAVAEAAWLAKAATAPADPIWTCQACTARTEAWTVSCPSCGGIDTLVWRAAGQHSA